MISMFRTGDIHIVSGFLYDNVEWELKKEEGYGGAKMYTFWIFFLIGKDEQINQIKKMSLY